MALNLKQVTVSDAERKRILSLISNHMDFYQKLKKEPVSTATLLKFLKVEVTSRKRMNVADRIHMKYTTQRRQEEKQEIIAALGAGQK